MLARGQLGDVETEQGGGADTLAAFGQDGGAGRGGAGAPRQVLGPVPPGRPGGGLGREQEHAQLFEAVGDHVEGRAGTGGGVLGEEGNERTFGG